MRRSFLEFIVGAGLLLGPLAYAVTIEPEVEVEVIEVPAATASNPSVSIPLPVIPEVEPMAEPPRLEPVERLDFAFVTVAGIVLHADPDEEWTTGGLRKHRGAGQFRAGKKVDASKIPEALWSLRGRSFDLYGPEGKVCHARIGDFTVVAQHDGPTDYDLFLADEPELDFEAFEAAPPKARGIRRRVWNHPDVHKWLVAEVLSDESCTGALWARDAELPPPEILRRSDAPSSLTRQRVAALEASEDYALNREEYETFRSELDDESRAYYGPWSQIEAAYPAKVQTWLDASDTAHFIEVDFGVDDEGCGEGAYTRITALDAVVDREFKKIERSVEPVTIFDADLDGAYEMLYTDEILKVDSASPALEQRLEVYQEWVCPC